MAEKSDLIKILRSGEGSFSFIDDGKEVSVLIKDNRLTLTRGAQSKVIEGAAAKRQLQNIIDVIDDSNALQTVKVAGPSVGVSARPEPARSVAEGRKRAAARQVFDEDLGTTRTTLLDTEGKPITGDASAELRAESVGEDEKQTRAARAKRTAASERAAKAAFPPQTGIQAAGSEMRKAALLKEFNELKEEINLLKELGGETIMETDENAAKLRRAVELQRELRKADLPDTPNPKAVVGSGPQRPTVSTPQPELKTGPMMGQLEKVAEGGERAARQADELSRQRPRRGQGDLERIVTGGVEAEGKRLERLEERIERAKYQIAEIDQEAEAAKKLPASARKRTSVANQLQGRQNKKARIQRSLDAMERQRDILKKELDKIPSTFQGKIESDIPAIGKDEGGTGQIPARKDPLLARDASEFAARRGAMAQETAAEVSRLRGKATAADKTVGLAIGEQLQPDEVQRLRKLDNQLKQVVAGLPVDDPKAIKATQIREKIGSRITRLASPAAVQSVLAASAASQTPEGIAAAKELLEEGGTRRPARMPLSQVEETIKNRIRLNRARDTGREVRTSGRMEPVVNLGPPPDTSPARGKPVQGPIPKDLGDIIGRGEREPRVRQRTTDRLSRDAFMRMMMASPENVEANQAKIDKLMRRIDRRRSAKGTLDVSESGTGSLARKEGKKEKGLLKKLYQAFLEEEGLARGVEVEESPRSLEFQKRMKGEKAPAKGVVAAKRMAEFLRSRGLSSRAIPLILLSLMGVAGAGLVAGAGRSGGERAA